jgi:hypothetical protein
VGLGLPSTAEVATSPTRASRGKIGIVPRRSLRLPGFFAGPDCTYFEALEQMELADDEALAQVVMDQAEPDAKDWHGEEPPF